MKTSWDRVRFCAESRMFAMGSVGASASGLDGDVSDHASTPVGLTPVMVLTRDIEGMLNFEPFVFDRLMALPIGVRGLVVHVDVVPRGLPDEPDGRPSVDLQG